MRKNMILPALAVAGGAAGFLLRRWQLASAYQPDTGLFVHGAPATGALLGLTALLMVVFLVLVCKRREGLDDFLPAFGSPSVGQMTVLAAAGLLLFAAGGFGLREGFRTFRLWQAAPEMYQLSAPVSQMLTGALCLAAGFGVLYMGQMAYRGRILDGACLLAPFPALAALVWLFAAHLKHGTEPVLMKYGFSLFAALLFTMAHYYIAGVLYGKPRPRRVLFCALLGAAVGITSLADGLDLFTAAATAAFTLSALGFAHGLLGGPWPDRMPPSEEETDSTAQPNF